MPLFSGPVAEDRELEGRAVEALEFQRGVSVDFVGGLCLAGGVVADGEDGADFGAFGGGLDLDPVPGLAVADGGGQWGDVQQRVDEGGGNGAVAEAANVAALGNELGELGAESVVEVRGHGSAAMTWKKLPVVWPRRLPAGVGSEP